MEVCSNSPTSYLEYTCVRLFQRLTLRGFHLENDPQPELVAQLAQEMYSNDMLQAMVTNMWRFEFEVCSPITRVLPSTLVFPNICSQCVRAPCSFLADYGNNSAKQARKDVAQIFNHLLRRQIGSRLPTVEYLSSKPDVVLSALKGCVPAISSPQETTSLSQDMHLTHLVHS